MDWSVLMDSNKWPPAEKAASEYSWVDDICNIFNTFPKSSTQQADMCIKTTIIS